jgi:hypothetical protein
VPAISLALAGLGRLPMSDFYDRMAGQLTLDLIEGID